MSTEDDLLELILRDSPGPEIESTFEARIADLYLELRNRHSWMFGFFRRVSPNQADVEEMANETLERYLRDINATLRMTEGLHFSLTPIVEAGELIGLMLPGTVEPIRDLHNYTFHSPNGWLATIARNVRNAFALKSGRLREKANIMERAAEFPTRRNGQSNIRPISSFVYSLYACPDNIEDRLVACCCRSEIRAAYLATLKELPAVQRAAWILCKDEVLRSAEAELYLAPLLHWRTVRSVLRAKPLSIADASRRLNRRDVSSDIFKAKRKLRQRLSHLNPSLGSTTQAIRWPPEFLVNYSSASGALRSSYHRGGRTITELDREHIETLSRSRKAHERAESQSSSEPHSSPSSAAPI